MIASIGGILSEKEEKYVVIEVGGVGYKVYISRETQITLPQLGDAVKLMTVAHYREDSQDLYGFSTRLEKDLFEMLNTVTGIGPKAAMNILGASQPKKLLEAIAHGEEDVLTSVSGIGKKMAAKIIMELKEKVGAITGLEKGGTNIGDYEVLEALRALGYGERQIQEALRSLPDNMARVEDRIRAALRKMAR